MDCAHRHDTQDRLRRRTSRERARPTPRRRHPGATRGQRRRRSSVDPLRRRLRVDGEPVRQAAGEPEAPRYEPRCCVRPAESKLAAARASRLARVDSLDLRGYEEEGVRSDPQQKGKGRRLRPGRPRRGRRGDIARRAARGREARRVAGVASERPDALHEREPVVAEHRPESREELGLRDRPRRLRLRDAVPLRPAEGQVHPVARHRREVDVADDVRDDDPPGRQVE